VNTLHEWWLWLASRTRGWYLLRLFDQPKQMYLQWQFPNSLSLLKSWAEAGGPAQGEL